MRLIVRGSLLIIISGIVSGLLIVSGVGVPSPALFAAQIDTPMFVPTISGEYIVVANDDLPRGFFVTEEYIRGPNAKVRLTWWPSTSIPEEGNYFTETEAIVGHWIRTDIPKGTPILARYLADSETELVAVGSDLALTLEQGEWAVPIRMSVIFTKPENLAPYDIVSVLVVLNPESESPSAIQLVQDAVIIEFQPDSDTITLAIDDSIAALSLIWAQDNRLPLIFVRHTPQ